MIQNISFSYLEGPGGGGGGGLTSNPGLPTFQGSKISSQSRQIENKGKNNH